jgi:hypothetical protein
LKFRAVQSIPPLYAAVIPSERSDEGPLLAVSDGIAKIQLSLPAAIAKTAQDFLCGYALSGTGLS